MLWDITGANRDTGEDATIQIEADTRESAIRRASRAGVLVSSAEPALIDFQPEPTIAYEPAPEIAASAIAAPPAFLPYASQSTGRPMGVPHNGLGIASLVLGCCSLLFIIVPCLNLITIPLALLGLVFGIISWVNAAKTKQSGIGFPIAGTAVSSVTLLILLCVAAFIAVTIMSMPKVTGMPGASGTVMSPAPPTISFPSASAQISQQQQILAAQQRANLAMQQSAQARQRAMAQQQQMIQQMQQIQPPQPQFQPVQPYQPPQPPQAPRTPGRPF